MAELTKKERAMKEVFESLKVINTSLQCYYGGDQHMYRAMAAQLRILFCDTQRGEDNSLFATAFSTFELARMRPISWFEPGSSELANPHLRRLRAVVSDNRTAQFAKMPFVVIEYGNGLIVADVELEEEGPLLSVDQWSDQLLTTHPAAVSIRDAIRLVADKGGGAHVDLVQGPALTGMKDAQPAGGVGQHILFTVAVSRLAANLGVHLEQLREQGALDGSRPGFRIDSDHESAKRMARVPEEVKATGARESHLCSVQLVAIPEPPSSPSE